MTDPEPTAVPAARPPAEADAQEPGRSADGPHSRLSANGPEAQRSADGPAPLLLAEGLVKAHLSGSATVPAVRGVSLRVERGEFVAVTGPSGAGKSTLLHLLGGLLRPDEGELRLDGRRVDRLGEADWAVLRRRRLGIVFQSGNLLGDLNVTDNVELPALLAGVPVRTARARRRELLAELGLGDKATAGPGALSGGERQRVALARALVNDPDLLLADEPTGNLDSRSTREVLALLTRYHRLGRTIVLVTHDARVASSADRVISLFDGRIADDSRVAEPEPGRDTEAVRRILELGAGRAPRTKVPGSPGARRRVKPPVGGDRTAPQVDPELGG